MTLNWTHAAIVIAGFGVGFFVGDKYAPGEPERLRFMRAQSLIQDSVTNMEDCMIVLMHGQPGVMFNTVQGMCERRFVGVVEK